MAKDLTGWVKRAPRDRFRHEDERDGRRPDKTRGRVAGVGSQF